MKRLEAVAARQARTRQLLVTMEPREQFAEENTSSGPDLMISHVMCDGWLCDLPLSASLLTRGIFRRYSDRCQSERIEDE